MNENDHEKLAGLIKNIQYAMMTTIDDAGKMHSRPMATMGFENDRDFEGVLWFFTRRDSVKVHEIQSEKEVNLTYADPSSQRFISILGLASIEKDKSRMFALWKPELKTWFPEGLEDPELVLLKVQVESADIWDAPPGKAMQLMGIAKSMVTGKTYEAPPAKNSHYGHPH